MAVDELATVILPTLDQESTLLKMLSRIEVHPSPRRLLWHLHISESGNDPT